MMLFLCIGNRCRSAVYTDCPDRLIRNPYFIQIVCLDAVQSHFDLCAQRLVCNAVLFLFPGFTDTQKSGKTVLHRCEHLFIFLDVTLSEDMPTLGMSGHHKVKVKLLEHNRRDFTGKLSFILPAHILCTKTDFRLIRASYRSLQRSVGRQDKQFHIRILRAKLSCAVCQFFQIAFRLCHGLIHF